MLGTNNVFTQNDENYKKRYERNLFDDLVTAIELLSALNDALLELHPEVIQKVRQLLI